MTAEPAKTRANRINSDSLDWSYIGDLRYGWVLDEGAACEAAIYGSFTADPEPVAADGQRFHCSHRSLDLGPAAGRLKTKTRIAREHGSWIAVTNAANEVRPNPRA